MYFASLHASESGIPQLSARWSSASVKDESFWAATGFVPIRLQRAKDKATSCLGYAVLLAQVKGAPTFLALVAGATKRLDLRSTQVCLQSQRQMARFAATRLQIAFL